MSEVVMPEVITRLRNSGIEIPRDLAPPSSLRDLLTAIAASSTAGYTCGDDCLDEASDYAYQLHGIASAAGRGTALTDVVCSLAGDECTISYRIDGHHYLDQAMWMNGYADLMFLMEFAELIETPDRPAVTDLDESTGFFVLFLEADTATWLNGLLCH